MAVRGCTCGVQVIVGGDHFRDCASLLPDPDTCQHTSGVRRSGELYCGSCGKGLSDGARPWFRDALAPGYAERQAEARAKANAAKAERDARESTYNLSGIYLDHGVTDLVDEELRRLIDCCTRELAARL